MISENALCSKRLPIQQLPMNKKQSSERVDTRTKVRPTTANFLRMLLKNQRLAELPQVNAKLAEILDERTGIVSAEVISARPVS